MEGGMETAPMAAVAEPGAAVDRRLVQRLHAARAETDALFRIVRPEHLYDRPVAERHRIAFYIGHLEAFDRNLLVHAFGSESPDTELDTLFAFGIDPVDGNLPQDTPADWPRLEQIFAYCERVRAHIDAAFERSTITPRLRQLLNAAIEHRLMHAETLSYLFHQLPFDCKQGRAEPCASETSALVPELVHVSAGATTLGLADHDVFGWDNEFRAQTLDVPAFAIDKCKISNGQFLRFVEQGGYRERTLWTDADWEWVTEQGIAHPAFWLREANAWRWKSMFETIPLPLDAPVYVSHAEASAYARWAQRQLPNEAQWQRAAFGAGARVAAASTLPQPPLRFDPAPAHARSLAPSFSGAVGMRGNGWEWTRTPFAPLPGFAPFDFYPGYSAPFFDGRHFVLKGGSPRTAACMLRPSFRNWFQAHYPYVYAGFRCVDSEQGGMS